MGREQRGAETERKWGAGSSISQKEGGRVPLSSPPQKVARTPGGEGGGNGGEDDALGRGGEHPNSQQHTAAGPLGLATQLVCSFAIGASLLPRRCGISS